MSFPRFSLLALVLALAPACDKAGETAIKASGALSDTERSLLVHLPAGANLVFGGDYQKLIDYWDSSPLKRMAELSTAKMGGGMGDYMDCWMDGANEADLVGSVETSGGRIEMNMIFRGLDPKKLTTCAGKGGFEVASDPDGKYIELRGLPDGFGGTSSAGYLFVAPTTAYFALDVRLGDKPKILSRKDLEARLARAASSPAIDSPAIKSLLEKADRSKPIWFSGTAANTPLADKMGAGHGWLDASKDSITVAFSIELDSAETASRAVSEFDKLRKNIDELPPELASAMSEILAGSRLRSSGKKLSGRFRVTNAAIDKMLPVLQGFGGM